MLNTTHTGIYYCAEIFVTAVTKSTIGAHTVDSLVPLPRTKNIATQQDMSIA